MQRGESQAAFDAAKAGAEAGNVDHEFNLALIYWQGVSIPQNYQEAMRWITLAAISGHKKAPAARAQILKATDSNLSQKAM